VPSSSRIKEIKYSETTNIQCRIIDINCRFCLSFLFPDDVDEVPT
jgi:hypothetical protein